MFQPNAIMPVQLLRFITMNHAAEKWSLYRILKQL